MEKVWRLARLLGAAAKNLYKGHGAEWAGALAYYSIVSVFPAALLAVSIFAYFVDETWAIQQIIGAVGGLLPAVSGAVARDVQEAVANRGSIGFIAFLVLAWTGSRVFSTLTVALDQALGRDPRTEHPLLAVGREVVLLVLTGVVLLVGTVAGLVLNFLAKASPVGTQFSIVVAATVTRTVLFGGAMFLIYSFVPYPRPPTRAASLGALASTILLVGAMPLFSTYVTKLGRYNLIYGPVAIVIVVLVWFWVASAIVLYGAHVAALFERRDRDA